MTGAAAQGFVLGLSTGAYCLGACAPVLVPYLVSAECRQVGQQARVVAQFALGRLLGYLVLALGAALVGPQVAQSQWGRPLLGVAALGLAITMLAHGIARNTGRRTECAGAGKLALARFPLPAGLFTGLRACPPVWLCVAAILAQGSVLAGVATGVAFFLATSVFLIPLALTGYLGAAKSLKEAADVAVLVGGLWFAVSGLNVLVGGCAPRQTPALAQVQPAAPATAAAPRVKPVPFPGEISGWKLVEGPTPYDAQTIYDYMDGAADAYMRYRFQGLTVGVYQKGKDRVTAEVYDMATGPEAFGIFSTDPTGEAVSATQGARYTQGVLRGWQGRYFLKLESTPPLQDVVAIARGLAARLGPQASPPELLSRLPSKACANGQVRFLHLKEDLNNYHYVSTANVLNLGPETDCVTADCRLKAQPVKLLLVRYRSPGPRDQAFLEYGRTILAEKPAAGDRDCFGKLEGGKASAVRKLGDGKAPMLAVVLEADSRGTCRAALDLMPKR
jgi:sulfite exporter TauE/SafE